MTQLLLHNMRIFDGRSEELIEGQALLIEDEIIRDVGDMASMPQDADRIDLQGQTLLPGLIDAHFHAYGFELDLGAIDHVSPMRRGLHAKRILEATLRRGFTTVRDAAGGDIELALALKSGLIDGPRFFYPGLALSQTGGHGDFRSPEHHEACTCHRSNTLAMLVDGADEVRRAVRDQLRKGASQIKLFVSGGVLSPVDPIWMNQFNDEEIRVAVEEAASKRAYVMAHCHTNEAALRCVRAGVRSIEHATLMEADGVRALVDHDAFAVPTFTIGEGMRIHAEAAGMPAVMIAKARELGDAAYASLDLLRQAKARIGFGTDVLGPVMAMQSHEFTLRTRVCTPVEILRQATSVNAALLRMEGRLGTVAPGALADLVAVHGNPLKDISALEQHDRMGLIVRDGKIVSYRPH